MEQIPSAYIRKIIHVDMDAFYASVEQRDRPELRGRPLAVGGSRERGVVAAASYEARPYGVHSALPSAIAYRRCPDLVFVKPRFDVYRQVSAQIREIFLDYTPLVEPLSLDEAYLDVTENRQGISTATRIARQIRARIRLETGLNASAGISINKFMAKMATDINKPNGQKTIMPEAVLAFLETLPIEKFYGVGEKTAQKMRELGIHTGADLKQWKRTELVRQFGKSGRHYYLIVRGIQHSRVKPDRLRKSVGAERTFATDKPDLPACREALLPIISTWIERVQQHEARGKTVTLKVKYHDFEIHTYSRSWASFHSQPEALREAALTLLGQHPPLKPVRLLGVTLSNLQQEPLLTEHGQLTLRF